MIPFNLASVCLFPSMHFALFGRAIYNIFIFRYAFVIFAVARSPSHLFEHRNTLFRAHILHDITARTHSFGVSMKKNGLFLIPS